MHSLGVDILLCILNGNDWWRTIWERMHLLLWWKGVIGGAVGGVKVEI